jgi:hypothetical protein
MSELFTPEELAKMYDDCMGRPPLKDPAAGHPYIYGAENVGWIDGFILRDPSGKPIPLVSMEAQGAIRRANENIRRIDTHWRVILHV